jgi:hypothetical protein
MSGWARSSRAAAFIDALALAYSGTPKTDYARKWRRFVTKYFPPGYAPVASAYNGFRCLLLHNFSAGETLAFTHDQPHKHLTSLPGGRVVLDRGSFVADIAGAFKAFRRDVLADDSLGERVLAWLENGHQPLGFWIPATLWATSVVGQRAAANAVTATGATFESADWQRRRDQPRSQPKMAPSIKQTRKEGK